MIRKKNLFLFLFFIILIIISFKFDPQIIYYVSLIRNEFLTDFLLGVTFLSAEIIIFFVLTSLFLFQERKRKWILPLWITMFFSVVIGYLLKIVFQRQRPFEIGIVISLVEILGDWNYSFPSFQSILVFSAIPLLSKEFPKFKYIWFLFAILVAFSRIYLGVHFLSDILVGALIGYLLGAFIVHLENYNKIWTRIHNILFG